MYVTKMAEPESMASRTPESAEPILGKRKPESDLNKYGIEIAMLLEARDNIKRARQEYMEAKATIN